MVNKAKQVVTAEPRLTSVETSEERVALFGLRFLTLFTRLRIQRSFSLAPVTKSAGGESVPDPLLLEESVDIGKHFV
jgi:hypothetical protein